MSWETWLAFVATYTVITILPGPSVFMSIAQSISKGLYPAFLCILGDVIGGLILMTLSYIGIGAILLASPTLFAIVKWFGILYMAFLGITTIINATRMSNKKPEKQNLSQHQNRSQQNVESMRRGFFVGLFNPKDILFYVAFLSQFVDPNGNALLQYFILSVSVPVIVIVVLFGYAALAVRARKFFDSLAARKRMEYGSGTLFLVGSAWMAITR